MVDLVTRITLIVYGAAVWLYFTWIAHHIKQLGYILGARPQTRLPLIRSLAWCGAAIALLWIVVPQLPFGPWAKLLSRLGILSATAPVFILSGLFWWRVIHGWKPNGG